MIEVELRDENVNQLLNRYNNQLGPRLRQVIAKACLRIEARAKRLAPVDTGRLRSNITHRISEQGKTIEGRVGPNVSYAKFQEFGTRPHYVSVETLRPWLRRHGLEQKVAQRVGIWVHRGSRRWFVPFAASPSLMAWAQAHGVAERKAVRVSGKAHPFLVPAWEGEYENIARDIQEAIRP